jgi:hypothetical protein
MGGMVLDLFFVMKTACGIATPFFIRKCPRAALVWVPEVGLEMQSAAVDET